jgi:hypothetical protein
VLFAASTHAQAKQTVAARRVAVAVRAEAGAEESRRVMLSGLVAGKSTSHGRLRRRQLAPERRPAPRAAEACQLAIARAAAAGASRASSARAASPTRGLPFSLQLPPGAGAAGRIGARRAATLRAQLLRAACAARRAHDAAAVRMEADAAAHRAVCLFRACRPVACCAAGLAALTAAPAMAKVVIASQNTYGGLGRATGQAVRSLAPHAARAHR